MHQHEVLSLLRSTRTLSKLSPPRLPASPFLSSRPHRGNAADGAAPRLDRFLDYKVPDHSNVYRVRIEVVRLRPGEVHLALQAEPHPGCDATVTLALDLLVLASRCSPR